MGRKPITLPKEELAQAISHGIPLSRLAQQYQVSLQTVYNYLHKYGLSGKKLSLMERQQLVVAREQGASVLSLAVKYGVTEETIRKHLKKS